MSRIEVKISKRGLGNYYGDVPLHKSGPNIGRIDRKELSIITGFTVKQLFKSYWNWQEIFRFPESNLKYSEYLDLLKEANITPSDVGNKPEQYNLSRYNDLGSYTKGNCRFITRKENLEEQIMFFGR